jgi:Domain of unknown function (DUF4177)
MRTKLLCVLTLICVVTLSATPQSKPAQWEYKFQYQCDEKKANALASEGWELVNMTASGSGMTTSINCAFKRPKS